MKKIIILSLPLAAALLVGSEVISMKIKKSYADAIRTVKTVRPTTLIKIVTVQSSTYHLGAALKRKRANPGEAFKQYKNEPISTWKKIENNKWVVSEGPAAKPNTDFEVVKVSHATQAAAVLSKLIDPLHAKHGEYARKTDYAKKEKAVIGNGKAIESYWPFS